jgi:ferritin-like metal-binding protein YciE
MGQKARNIVEKRLTKEEVRMDSGKDLLEHELKDMYDAENRLLDALDTMAGKVTDGQLAQGFKMHREQTQGQIERLEEVFAAIDSTPDREECHGIVGLIEEFDSFVKEEDPSEDVLNVFASSAALKVEHYEIASYKSLIKLAHQAGMSDAVSLLEQNLNEELANARKLETMGIQLGEQLASKG